MVYPNTLKYEYRVSKIVLGNFVADFYSFDCIVAIERSFLYLKFCKNVLTCEVSVPSRRIMMPGLPAILFSI